MPKTKGGAQEGGLLPLSFLRFAKTKILKLLRKMKGIFAKSLIYQLKSVRLNSQLGTPVQEKNFLIPPELSTLSCSSKLKSQSFDSHTL